MIVPTNPQNSLNVCQSRPLRASRDASIANTAPTRPFEVNIDAMRERIPIELETLADWTQRQDWRDSNLPRPPAG